MVRHPNQGAASRFQRCYNCAGCRAPNCGACRGCRRQYGPKKICVRRPCYLYPNQPMPRYVEKLLPPPRQCYAKGCSKAAQQRSKYCSIQCNIDSIKTRVLEEQKNELRQMCAGHSQNTKITSKWEKLRQQLIQLDKVQMGEVTIHKIKSDKKANGKAEETNGSNEDVDTATLDSDGTDSQ